MWASFCNEYENDDIKDKLQCTSCVHSNVCKLKEEYAEYVQKVMELGIPDFISTKVHCNPYRKEEPTTRMPEAFRKAFYPCGTGDVSDL